MYEELLNDKEYIKDITAQGNIKTITNSKWDWEHGIGHVTRTAEYAEIIFKQLNKTSREIELIKVAVLLHDLGLLTGDKLNHAISSLNYVDKYFNLLKLNIEEQQLIKHAILDHSNGKDLTCDFDAVLVLADKIDMTYHRTIDSSIKDDMNNNVLKIKEIKVEVNNSQVIINYLTDNDFDFSLFREWPKPLTIPKKIAAYWHKELIFQINNQPINTDLFN